MSKPSAWRVRTWDHLGHDFDRYLDSEEACHDLIAREPGRTHRYAPLYTAEAAAELVAQKLEAAHAIPGNPMRAYDIGKQAARYLRGEAP